MVPIFQSECYIRWGSDRQQQDKITMPAKVIGRNAAPFLYGAVDRAMAALSVDALRPVAALVRWFFYVCFPDALAGNRLVMQKISTELPRALLFEGTCAGHMLMISVGGRVGYHPPGRSYVWPCESAGTSWQCDACARRHGEGWQEDSHCAVHPTAFRCGELAAFGVEVHPPPFAAYKKLLARDR